MFEYKSGIGGLYAFFVMYLGLTFKSIAQVCPYWLEWNHVEDRLYFMRIASAHIKVTREIVWEWMDVVQVRYMIFPMRIVNRNGTHHAVLILCDRSTKMFILIDPMNGPGAVVGDEMTDYTYIVNLVLKSHPSTSTYDFLSLQGSMLECQAFLEPSRLKLAPNSRPVYCVPLSIYMAYAILAYWPLYENYFLCLPHFVKRYVCDPRGTIEKVQNADTEQIRTRSEDVADAMLKDFQGLCLETDKPWLGLMEFCETVMVTFRDNLCRGFWITSSTFSGEEPGPYHGWYVNEGENPDTEQLFNQGVRIEYAYHYIIASDYLKSKGRPAEWNDEPTDRMPE